MENIIIVGVIIGLIVAGFGIDALVRRKRGTNEYSAPKIDKEFSYKEGDFLLKFSDKFGKYSVMQVLKIDKCEVKKGQPRLVSGGQGIRALKDDFFLVVSVRWTDPIYNSFEEVDLKNLDWTAGHVPMRPSGLTSGKPFEVVGNNKVEPDDLVGYKQWKGLFDLGKAGVW